MLAILCVLVIGFFLYEGVVFGAHRLMHERWTGPLWRSHQLHHKLYNPKSPASSIYKEVGWRSFKYRALIFLAVVGAFFCLLPFWMAFALLVEVSVLSAVSTYIHDATHIADHDLERFGWFRYLKGMHWTHHANTKKNLGIITFLFDRLAGSKQ